MEYRSIKFKVYTRGKGWSEEWYPGRFHQWGYKSYEDSAGNIVESVALIEDAQGVIHEIEPSKVMFTIPILM